MALVLIYFLSCSVRTIVVIDEDSNCLGKSSMSSGNVHAVSLNRGKVRITTEHIRISPVFLYGLGSPKLCSV